jgi:hypothetical protein
MSYALAATPCYRVSVYVCSWLNKEAVPTRSSLKVGFRVVALRS